MASSFMSPLDSRNSDNTGRVRMFPNDKLVQKVACEKWDRVKVVCTQPFNRNVKYGLSFLQIQTVAEKQIQSMQKESGSSVKIGKFTIKDDDDGLEVGSLFNKRKEKPTQPTPVTGEYFFTGGGGGIT